MNIKFNNGINFEYTQAYAIEKDHYKGETRPSIEVHLPITQTSYDEIASITGDAEIMQSFTLVGDMPQPIPVYKTQEVEKVMTDENGEAFCDEDGNPLVMTSIETVVDENGEPVVDYYEQPDPVMNTYEGYIFGDKIIVENGILIFKKYKASDAEMENTELKQAVDMLLIALEV